jgi:DNA-binding MurR/RpiR family transcriptional regulator
MTAAQLRHRGISAEATSNDPVLMSGTLISLAPGTLVIGISATEYGASVAKALAFARSKGCATLGVVGSLASPVNRMSDQVVFAPTDVAGPLPSIVGLSAALSALVQIAAKESDASVEKHNEEFQRAFTFLVSPDASEPPEEEV